LLEAKAIWEHTCIAGGLFSMPIQKGSHYIFIMTTFLYYILFIHFSLFFLYLSLEDSNDLTCRSFLLSFRNQLKLFGYSSDFIMFLYTSFYITLIFVVSDSICLQIYHLLFHPDYLSTLQIIFSFFISVWIIIYGKGSLHRFLHLPYH